MDLTSTMAEPMGEALPSSVVEACVHLREPESPSMKLERLKTSFGILATSAHAFRRLIKARSHAQDTNGVWRCLTEMRSRHIRPKRITIGCMA